MSLPELNPAGIRLRSRERADMVGSSFVSEDEVARYNAAAFLKFLGIVGTRFDETLLRRAKATAFANQSAVQLGAQCPQLSAGWTAYATTFGTVTVDTPTGDTTAVSAQHTVAAATSWGVIPITNMEFRGNAPNVTFEMVCKSNDPANVFAYFEVATSMGTNDPSAADLTKVVWVNLTTGVVGTLGAGINAQCDTLDSSSFQLYKTWKKLTITFKPLGPRHSIRFAVVTADNVTTRTVAYPLHIASVKVYQTSTMKKLRGVRIDGGRFLRRRNIRDFESYSLTNQVTAPEPEGYILRGDNGRESMPELLLMPAPTANLVLEYYFVPSFNLEDACGMSLVAGWDEYVVVTSAIKMKDKEESDVAVLMAEQASLEKSMLDDLEPMDTSEPAGVARFGGPGVDPFSQMVQEEVF